MQKSLHDKEEELKQAQREQSESEAVWESRLQEAVHSATEWKDVAEKLSEERSGLNTKIENLQTQSEVYIPALSNATKYVHI